ncbi:MAG: Ig-like domain-containing protein [Thermodesulfobacteriota bacterium]|nr:Ig-like domain-containing protein [Thermodesulfobacteriota bacterium]
MKKGAFLVFLLMVTNVVVAGGEQDSRPPRVVSTFPQNGSIDVDPSLNEISVTFNEAMRDGNWSWVYEDKNTFPQIVGQAYYNEDMTKNVLPVKLEPNKEYVIWINSQKFNNFKDKSGNPAFPFKFTFKTR